MTTFDFVLLGIVAVYTIACLITDLGWRRIPNWLTVSSLALALIFHGVGHGIAGLKFSVYGFGTGFGLLLALYFIGGGGGGDVKMMGALGAWLGTILVLKVFLGTAIVAMAIVWGLMLYDLLTGKRSARRGARRSKASGEGESFGSRRKVPYAVPVAVSTWFFLALHIWQIWKLGIPAFYS